MKKTEFYKYCTESEAELHINNRPVKLWFVLEDTLYDTGNNIINRITTIKEGDKIYGKDLFISSAVDLFENNGIVRRICFK